MRVQGEEEGDDQVGAGAVEEKERDSERRAEQGLVGERMRQREGGMPNIIFALIVIARVLLIILLLTFIIWCLRLK